MIISDDFQKKYMDRLVAVSNRKLINQGKTIEEQIEKVGHLHPHAIILREKDLSETEYEELADNVIQICNKAGVMCILHNYADVAINLDCRNIHLPLDVLKAIVANDYKTNLGRDIRNYFEKIGTSIHSVEDAIEAEKLGVTYVTAGHIYATDCKKGLPPRGIEFLKAVCESVKIPVYAIGGIEFDAKQLDEVLNCGAAGACLMSGFMEI
jgi:thiamine-phosphate pyrophosphorylase